MEAMPLHFHPLHPRSQRGDGRDEHGRRDLRSKKGGGSERVGGGAGKDRWSPGGGVPLLCLRFLASVTLSPRSVPRDDL